MDSPDPTTSKDSWPKKPVEIKPNDLADLLEEIWGIEKAKPKSPNKSSTSSHKKSPDKEDQEEKMKSYFQPFPHLLDYSMNLPRWAPPQYNPLGQKVNTKEDVHFLRQVDKRIMEMKSWT